MNAHESKIKNLLKTVITAVADSGEDEWPPKCTALLYQPVRPDVSSSAHHCVLTEVK